MGFFVFISRASWRAVCLCTEQPLLTPPSSPPPPPRLNEGFTVYAERRIIEALEGSESYALHAAIGRLDLEEAVASLPPELTKLRTHLQGVDPDEAFSQVPYEKGFLLLRTIEAAVGRAAFDAFLAKYISTFKWKTLTSEDFCAFLRSELPAAVAALDLASWMDAAGIPPGAPEPHSIRLDAVASLGAALPSEEMARGWTPTEWQLYLDRVPRPAPPALCAALEARHRLTESTNMEVLVSWLHLAVQSGHDAVLPRVEQVLGSVGRMKYLKPLYKALVARPETRELAGKAFAANQAGYHPIARQVIEGVVR